ncbi:MAG: hypothetical protein RR547_05065 [Raoultibacter sp.]
MKNCIITATTLGICMFAVAGLCACAPQPDSASGSQSSQQEQQSAESKKSESKAPTVQVEVKTKECLSCHPYDEVMAKSAEYVTPEGEKANPHRTVDENADKPHEATGSEVPYDCAGCHTAHPNPPTEAVELPASVSSC